MKIWIGKVLKSLVALLICVNWIACDALGQTQTQTPDDEQVKSPVEAEWGELISGFDEKTSDRMTTSLRKGAFSRNESVCYRSLEIFSTTAILHQKLGEGVQLELVKRGLEQASTRPFAFSILLESSIKGVERQDLLIAFFEASFERNSGVDRGDVLTQLQGDSEKVIDRIVTEIENKPLGDHAARLKLLEHMASAHMGVSAEKALPALKKRYQALKDLAEKEGRPANYLELLFVVGEIGSSDGMDIILDACDERGGKERQQYVEAGLECLKRVLARNTKVLDPTTAAMRAKYGKYADSLFKNYDIDKDGFLAKDEVAKMRRPPVNADRNRDGKVSKSELVTDLARNTKVATRSTSSSRSRNVPMIRNSIQNN